jgi:hypothetical protein
MFSATLKHTTKQKYYQTKLEKRMLCQIWQYPKIVTQEKKKFQEIHNTVFQNYIVFTAF